MNIEEVRIWFAVASVLLGFGAVGAHIPALANTWMNSLFQLAWFLGAVLIGIIIIGVLFKF